MIKSTSPRVRHIAYTYQHENLQGVLEYLTQENMIVDPSTWSHTLKETIEAEQYHTAKQLIEIVMYKFVNLNTL